MPSIGLLHTVADALPSLTATLDRHDAPWHLVSDSPGGADHCAVLVIGGDPFGAEQLGRFAALRLLVRAGVGLDRIDLDSCARRGIQVRNTPGYGTDELADHALMLMLAVNRRLGHFTAVARRGSWDRVRPTGVRRLAGATLGIIGVGRIGREMARRGQLLGMSVLGTDPELATDTATALGIRAVDIAELLSKCDVISLHAPLTDETREILDRTAFAAMRRTPIVINTARGELINTSDLRDALDAGIVSGAGLDVLAGEPNPDPILLNRPDVIITPHIGWYAEESRTELGRLAAAAAMSAPDGDGSDAPPPEREAVR